MTGPLTVNAPTLHHGDSLEFVRGLPSGSVNLIFADGPYYKVKGDAWDRQWKTPAAFLAWMGEHLAEWQRVLAPNGSLYVCASPQMAARVECLVAERFDVLNAIVWSKADGAGRHRGSEKEALRSYFPATERIIFAEQRGADSMAMGESGYEAQCERLRGFVFEPLRAYLAGEWERAGLTSADLNECTQSQMAGHYLTRVQWALPTEAKYQQLQARASRVGVGFLPREYSDLRCEYEELRRDYVSRCAEYETLRRPFTVTAEVPYTDVWTFSTVQAYPGKHPCEKPAALLDHVIAASSRSGDVVLDPFMGSGATGERAALLGRRFIGCELGDYFPAAEQRVRDAAERGVAFAPRRRGPARTPRSAPAPGQLGLWGDP